MKKFFLWFPLNNPNQRRHLREEEMMRFRLATTNLGLERERIWDFGENVRFQLAITDLGRERERERRWDFGQGGFWPWVFNHGFREDDKSWVFSHEINRPRKKRGSLGLRWEKRERDWVFVIGISTMRKERVWDKRI